MRWLINYIRSCFCKHEWELIYHDEGIDATFHTKFCHKVYRCNKCGYSKEYKI